MFEFVCETERERENETENNNLILLIGDLLHGIAYTINETNNVGGQSK